MTRINVVPVKELSDQWLIAEYRELPRVVKQNINVDNAPSKYKLGEGHVKWARKHIRWIENRYAELCNEMDFRGFKVNHNWYSLHKLIRALPYKIQNYYDVTKEDIILNRDRLIEKYNSHYTWTKRRKPLYFMFKWLRRF